MIGSILRTYRKKSGMTQEELAYKAEIHRTYVSLLERDQKSPTLKVFFRLAEALDMRPSEMMEEVEGELEEEVA